MATGSRPNRVSKFQNRTIKVKKFWRDSYRGPTLDACDLVSLLTLLGFPAQGNRLKIFSKVDSKKSPAAFPVWLVGDFLTDCNG